MAGISEFPYNPRRCSRRALSEGEKTGRTRETGAGHVNAPMQSAVPRIDRSVPVRSSRNYAESRPTQLAD